MSSAPPLSILSAAEQQTHAQMGRQFARFDLMAGEVKKRVDTLESTAAAAGAEVVDPAAIAPVLQSSYLHLLELKGVARALTNLAEATKAQLQSRKKRLDVVNLQYESILYEQSHFQKEIAIARDFKSKHAPIELVSEADFRAGSGSGGSGVPPAVPAHISAHELHLLRLHDELDRRTRLQQAQREAEARNAALQAENDALRAKAAAFIAHFKAAELSNRAAVADLWPADAALHTPPSSGDESLLPLLPAPLYKLYFVADSYAKGHGLAPADFALTVVGSASDAAEARAAEIAQAAHTPPGTTLWPAAVQRAATGEVASDNAAPAVSAAELAQLVKPHPLRVELSLRLPAARSAASGSFSAPQLVLSFSFHPHLRAVSVACRGASGAAVPASLLSDLWSHDSGNQLPLDISAYPHRVASAVSSWAQQGFAEPPLAGRFFRFAQLLAGLYVLPTELQRSDASAALATVSFGELIERLAERAASLGNAV